MREETMALCAFRQYGDQVLRLAYCYTNNMREAEEITKTVFLTLHEQQPELKSAKQRVYLLREAAGYSRSCRRKTDGTLTELPAECAAVLCLHDHEGCTAAEIAEILGKRIQYIEALLAQGRNQLDGRNRHD